MPGNKVEPDSIEQPSEYTPWNVMYWEPESQELRRKFGTTSILRKARDFLQAGCIEKTEFGWICKPLKGYNKTTYKIQDTEKSLRCNCQGFNKNNKCCHALSVKQFIFMNFHNKGGEDF